ncbi:MAG: hypothetical protein U0L72_09885 [Acutalibacteraceae bacterium]|nr:hypothetical protein [Acutalibacteraceae bacterium]
MVKIIIGKKGSGKTKKLMDVVNAAAEQSKGCVVCFEQGDTLKFSITHKVRLIDADHYGIKGFDAYYGMICGVCAGNYDVTEIFGDATLRIGSRDYAELADFLKKVDALSRETNIDFFFTVSANEDELPEAVLAYVEK